MSLTLLHTDLYRFPCDAAVIPSDEWLQYSGREAVCAPGRAAPAERGCCEAACSALFVTVAPPQQSSAEEAAEVLAACYRNSLDLAAGSGCKKIAVRLIVPRIPGFSAQSALETAVETILAYPGLPAPDVYLIAQDSGNAADFLPDLARYLRRMLRPAAKLSESVQMNAVPQDAEKKNVFFGRPFSAQKARRKAIGQDFAAEAECAEAAAFAASGLPLEARLQQLDESFTQMLLRKIDEAGMKDSECYKRANVSKQLFSKIRSDMHYRPRKETVLAFALALQLDLDETNALLRTAGYSLSHSSKADIIIEYFIIQKNYNVFLINEALYRYDQRVLGSE